MIKLLAKLAFRFIFHKHEGLLKFVSTSFKLSIVTLSLSIFSIIILNSFYTGYKSEVKIKLKKYHSDLEIITTSKSTFERIINHVETNYSENFQFAVTMSSLGVLKSDEFSHGVEVISCMFDSCSEKKQPNHITLGSNTYDKILQKENSEVYIINAQSMLENFGFNKKISKFKVSSNELKSAMPQDRNKVLIDEENFFNLFENNMSNVQYSIKVFYKKLDFDKNTDYYYNQLYKNLVKSIPIDNLNSYYAISFEERFVNLSESIDQIFATISIILYFFIVLSTANITSSVWLIIESKNQQINFLTLMGFSNTYIFILILFLTFTLVSISFVTGYFFSELILYIQNSFNVIKVPEDVYIISGMNLKIDRMSILKFFLYFNLLGVIMSIFPYLKATSNRNIYV